MILKKEDVNNLKIVSGISETLNIEQINYMRENFIKLNDKNYIYKHSSDIIEVYKISNGDKTIYIKGNEFDILRHFKSIEQFKKFSKEIFLMTPIKITAKFFNIETYINDLYDKTYINLNDYINHLVIYENYTYNNDTNIKNIIDCCLNDLKENKLYKTYKNNSLEAQLLIKMGFNY